MRPIKFQFIFKGLPYSSTCSDFNWHKKVYSLDQLTESRLDELCHLPSMGELIAKRQFTGLTDKNGVDIYEGDLIENGSGRISEVVFNDYYATFDSQVRFTSGKDSSFGFTNSMWKRCVKIIGNIYQSPELMESK